MRSRGGDVMPHIIIDEQQARLTSEATGDVEIRDSEGRHLGYVAHGFTDEDIAIARQRLTSIHSRYTTREVLDHRRPLEHNSPDPRLLGTSTPKTNCP